MVRCSIPLSRLKWGAWTSLSWTGNSTWRRRGLRRSSPPSIRESMGRWLGGRSASQPFDTAEEGSKYRHQEIYWCPPPKKKNVFPPTPYSFIYLTFNFSFNSSFFLYLLHCYDQFLISPFPLPRPRPPAECIFRCKSLPTPPPPLQAVCIFPCKPLWVRLGNERFALVPLATLTLPIGNISRPQTFSSSASNYVWAGNVQYRYRVIFIWRSNLLCLENGILHSSVLLIHIHSWVGI